MIPNTKEAEDTLALINSHIGGFLWNVLKKAKAEDAFVTRLLKKTLDLKVALEAPQCTIDWSAMTMRTPGTNRKKQARSHMADQSFFKDLVGEILAVEKAATKKGKNRDYVDPAMRFDLDGAKSVQTATKGHEGYTKTKQGKVIDFSEPSASAADDDNKSKASTPTTTEDLQDESSFSYYSSDDSSISSSSGGSTSSDDDAGSGAVGGSG